MKRNKQLTGQQTVPVSYHIKELRNRFFLVLGFFIAGSVVGYIYQVAIIAFLNRYIDGNLYYTSPAGNFNFIMKVSLLAGVLFAIPITIYQIIKFTQPALKARHQYKRTWIVAFLALALALTGMAFAMWIIVPMSLHFFAGFNVNGVKPLISADEYLNYVIKALLWFAVLFQIPLLMLFINKITPLKPRKLIKYEKFVVVAALIIALVLPFTYDPVTQFIIAIPIVMLYNLSIVLIWLSNRSDIKQALRQQKAASAYNETKTKHQPPNTPIASLPKQESQPQLKPALATAIVVKKPSKITHTKRRLISDFGVATQNNAVKRPTVSLKTPKVELQQQLRYSQPRSLSMDMVLPTNWG